MLIPVEIKPIEKRIEEANSIEKIREILNYVNQVGYSGRDKRKFLSLASKRMREIRER